MVTADKRRPRSITSQLSTWTSNRRQFKLLPEFVPFQLWGVSAYRLVNGECWNCMREAAMAETGRRCSICGVNSPPRGFRDGRLYCHEVWRYDERKAVATLTRLRMLCAGCNSVIHLGRTNSLGYLDQALAHLGRVNGVSKKEATRLWNAAGETWRKRNELNWSVAVAKRLLAKYPDLKVLQRTRPVAIVDVIRKPGRKIRS